MIDYTTNTENTVPPHPLIITSKKVLILVLKIPNNE